VAPRHLWERWDGKGCMKCQNAARSLGTGSPDINLMGGCLGGMMAAIVAALLAARGDDRVNSVTMGVTLLDLQTDAQILLFAARGALRRPGEPRRSRECWRAGRWPAPSARSAPPSSSPGPVTALTAATSRGACPARRIVLGMAVSHDEAALWTAPADSHCPHREVDYRA
jgi:hypothetical protein